MRRRIVGTLLACAIGGALGAALEPGQEQVLDTFDDPGAWHLSATDDVKASLRPARGPHGASLCIDYDFGSVTGYVALKRSLPLDYPARYEFALDLQGDGPSHAFQFKLVDASGENVWWVTRPDHRFPATWQSLKLRQRQIGFAWGPIADKTLRHSESVELVIASGNGAGRGSACFDRLSWRRLPDTAPQAPTPRLLADALTVDYGLPREFGALDLRWRDGAAASGYAIDFSDDGLGWRRVRRVDAARGQRQLQWLPESETRFVRIVPDTPAALDAIEPLDAASVDTFFMRLAQDAPRGRYPRAYAKEQSYWTVLGVDGARTASLLGEDGALEPIPGVGGLEPFLVSEGKVLSWADAAITHGLRDGELPMPAVHWRAGGLALDLEAFGQGEPGSAQVLARYTVRNLGARTLPVTLALAWRPFQVNPPTQFLAHPGGASAITSLGWDGEALSVDGTPRLLPRTAPTDVQLQPLAAGPVGDWLTDPTGDRAARQLIDPASLASAALRYALTLAPGQSRSVVVALPVEGAPPVPADFDAAAARVATEWRQKLDRVRLHGPAEVEDIGRTLRTALGHILVNRSGPALQPGARAYARSWIRDGALTSSALLRLGHAQAVSDFLRWYAPFQFQNGKIPCCATVRGADPVPENDSDGEFAYAVAELWRYTDDTAGALAMWPRVRAAIGHMESLRQRERSEANRSPDRAAYFGLMPPSISHEGYSDKPAYSYWDDFWTSIGYHSALDLARGLGETADARRIAAEAAEFDGDLLRSIVASSARHGLDLLPGSADRGDVDPTSSTISLSPGAMQARLPADLVRNTFERYWHDFEERRRDEAAGRRHGDGAYTPYEWRNVGALLRLGQRERALQAFSYFYRDRRPAGWNQWAEVVARDPREPRFLGDMPHGWVASDHIRAVLDLFVYEDESTQGLVLAAGVPMRWLGGQGLGLHGLRTPWGRIGWEARERAVGGRPGVELRVDSLSRMPPGGIHLRGPWPASSRVWIDGRAHAGAADDIVLSRTPARVRVELP